MSGHSHDERPEAQGGELFDEALDLLARALKEPNAAETSRETAHSYLSRRRVDVRDLLDKLGPVLRQRVPRGIRLEIQPAPWPFVVQADSARLSQLLRAMVEYLCARLVQGRLVLSPQPPDPDTSEAALQGSLTLTGTADWVDGADSERFRLMQNALSQSPNVPTRKELEQRSHAAGGRLIVDQAPDTGRFTLILHFGPDALRSTSSSPIIGASSVAVAATVLIVEDDDLLRTILERLLTRSGYRVFVARDGYQAQRLFIANKDHIDVVLLDVQMPAKHGGQVLMELSHLKPGQAFIVSSGYPLDSATETLVRTRRIPFLPKPYPPEQLLDTLNALLHPTLPR